MSDAWYHAGLRFACTRCGQCCTGAAGSVRVSAAEAEAIARQVGLPLEEFLERCTRWLEDGALSLVEKPNLECVFWDREQGCTIHPVRPKQCRTWPFWRANLASPAHWTRASVACPGMDRGPLHEASSIAEQAADDGTSGAIR